MSPELSFPPLHTLRRWLLCVCWLLLGSVLGSAALAQSASLVIPNQASAQATSGDVVIETDSNIVETVLSVDAVFGELLKSATPPSGSDVVIGEEIAYEVSFETSSIALDNVVFEDVLSARLEPLGPVTVTTSPDASVAAGARSDITDNTVTVLWDALPANTRVSIGFRARVLERGPIENTARIRTSTVEGETLSNTTVHQGLEAGIRDLQKTATPAGGVLDPGDALDYSVRFQVFDVPLTGVVVRDELDPNLEAPSSFSDGTITDPETGATIAVDGSYDAATRTIVWRFERLEPGTTVVLNVSTRVANDAPGGVSIDNEACVSGQGIDGVVCSNQTQHTVASFCALELGPDGTVAEPGQRLALEGGAAALRYTLTNTGNAPYTYTLDADVLSASTLTPELSLVIAESAQRDDTAPYTLRTTALGAGETLDIVIEVRSGQRGEAFIDLSGRCDNDPSITDTPNVGAVFDVIPGVTDLVKGADPAPGSQLSGGQALSYTLSFENRRVPLQNVVIRDPLNDHLVNPRNATSGTLTDPDTGATTEVSFGLEDGGRTLVWRIAELPSGFRVVLDVRVTVDRNIVGETSIDNVFSVTSDATEAQDSNVVEHTAYPPELIITKDVTPEQALVGQAVRYTVMLMNPSANVALEALELLDTLPPGTRYVVDTATITRGDTTTAFDPEVRDDGGEIFWSALGRLEPGAQLSLAYDLRILPDALNHDELVNIASATARNADNELVAFGAAAADIVINDPMMSANATILGSAYIDNDQSGTLSDGDTPVTGLRLYLPTGISTVTDEFGRYTFPEVAPGVTALKVDPTTLPARALQPTPGEEAPGLWTLRPRAGLILRRDIPFESGTVDLFVRRRLSLSQGPLTVSKFINPIETSRDPDTGLPTRWAVSVSVTSDTVVTNLFVRDLVVAGMSTRAGDAALLQEALDTGVVEGVGGALSATEDGVGVFRLRLEPDQLLLLRYELSLLERPALSVPQLSWETE